MPRKLRKVPQRVCVGCQEKKEKNELIRIVRTPEDEILIDRTGKKSGRGAYICAIVSCLSEAQKKRRLEKSLKCSISSLVYENLQQSIEESDE